MNKIIFLGKSENFLNIFLKKYHKNPYYVVPWRDLRNNSETMLNELRNPKVIIICGYNYCSSHINYEEYIKSNINQPIQFLKKIKTDKTKVFYINTDYDDRKKYTFSRYLYAKNLLSNYLLKNCKNLKIIRIPTLADNEGKLLIYGNKLTKFLFNFAKSLGIIKTITIEQFEALIDHKDEPKNICLMEPIGLRIGRPLLIDRALRIIFG